MGQPDPGLSHFTNTLSSHLDAEAGPRGEILDPELHREVPGHAPAEAVVPALHHHGAGRGALVQVEADWVDQNDRAHFLIHHHRAQVQAVRHRPVVHDEAGGRPSGSWRKRKREWNSEHVH